MIDSLALNCYLIYLKYLEFILNIDKSFKLTQLDLELRIYNNKLIIINLLRYLRKSKFKIYF